MILVVKSWFVLQGVVAVIGVQILAKNIRISSLRIWPKADALALFHFKFTAVLIAIILGGGDGTIS